jgi:cellulose synthase (UDP-forming)
VSLPSRNFDLRTHLAIVAAWTPNSYPSVDIWLPICGEEVAVLENTWLHVNRLAEAYPGTVAVYVLDDGDDPNAATLAASYGFSRLVRPNRGWMKKAGNLRYAYQNSSGEFIAIFDADFAPREDFLAETVPYMQKHSSLGIVQTPQFFRHDRDQTLMERGAGAVQELFYRVVQVSGDRVGGAICVGSCGLYRRVALESIGGPTLIEHSEDVHTGFDLYRRGWNLRYLPIALATGISPLGPDSFLTQQYRWCAGTMSLLGSPKFWSPRLKLSTLCCYLSGFFYYIQTAIATFAVPLIPIVLLAFLPEFITLRNYLWIAPSAIYTVVIFPLWNTGRYGPSSFMAKGLYGWAHVFSLADTVRGRRQGWHATGASTQRPTRRIWVAILIWGVITTAAWVGLAIFRMVTMKPINFVILLIVGFAYGWTRTAMPFLARTQTTRRESRSSDSTLQVRVSGQDSFNSE